MKSLLPILFFFIGTSSLAQLSESDSTYAHYLDVLIETGEHSRMLQTQEQRNAAADSFKFALSQVVQFEDALQYTFRDVSNLSIVSSENENIRFLTYMVPQRGGTYAHYGFLLFVDEEDEYHHVELENDPQNNPIYKPLKSNHWYGALYYEIIEKEVDDRTVYFLLGYRSVNPNVHQKVVDVLDLANNRVQFGLDAFHVPSFNDIDFERAPYRLTMSYAAKSSALLQWNEDYKGIVMDHVSPPDASQKGFYMVYGPDFTYDGLKWKDEEWHFEKMIIFGNDVQTPPAGGDIPTTLGPPPPPKNENR